MKSIRSLRIPLIVLVVLCLLFLIYYLLTDTRQGTDDVMNTGGKEEVLLDLPMEEILSVTVRNMNGDSFTISSDEITPEARQWQYFGPDGLSSELTFSQVILNDYVAALSRLSSISRIGAEKPSLLEYGLETPEYVVEIAMSSGQVNQVLIGDYSIDKESIYIQINTVDEIYLVSSNLRSLCEYSYLDFMDTQLVSVPYEQVSSFSFKRKTDPIDVVLCPDYSDNTAEITMSQWKFKSPFSFLASNKMSGFIESVLNLSIYKFISLDENVNDYGLDDPEYTFSIIKSDGTEVEINMSKLTGNYYYGRTNLSPNIFMVSQDSLSGLQIPLLEQISPVLYTEDISEIKSIQATFPEGSFLLEMDLQKDENILSDQSEIYIDKRNAKVSDSEGNAYFEVLYKSISFLKISELDFQNNPQNMETVSIKIFRKDGSSISVDYSKIDDESYGVFIDGIYMGFIVDKSEIYGEDGTNYSGYGIWGAYELLDRALDGQMNGKYDIPEL